MTKEEILQELQDMEDCDCSIVEMWEFVEDNSDLDPTEIFMSF